MQSHTGFFIFVCLTALVSVSFAQKGTALPQQKPASVSEADDTNALSFPYLAQITEDEVNIRSGPGTNYYRCGKLNKADKIKVVGSQFSWSRIVPSPGSFSWIAKQHVSIDPNDAAVGIVTGDAVRVYAGSDFTKPIHSTTVQLRLNKGDKVSLLGAEEDDYYKIAPPDGAYLWVSTEYVQPIGPLGETFVETPFEPNAGPNTPSLVPIEITVESVKLKEYYELAKQFLAERSKPMDQQDYTALKKAFAAIVDTNDAGKAARYSEFAIKQIARCELAIAVSKEAQLQDAQLQQNRQQIENARLAKLAEVQDLGRFAVIGQFKVSNIYDPEMELKHYRIIGNSGQTICYALPSGSASQGNLDKLLGCKVGLVGSIEPHPQTGVALVRFTEIVELK